jgi:hypothetical protein
MAEVRNFLFGMLFVVAVLSFGAAMFSYSTVVGGWSAAYPSSFNNSLQYMNKTDSISRSLAVQTQQMGEAPVSTTSYDTIFIIGLQILTLPIDAVNLAITMLFDVTTNPEIGGYIPFWFVVIAIDFLVLTLVLGIIAAVVKWYL